MPTPSAFEQEMLELINRARANPSGEFDAIIKNAATGEAFSDDVTNAVRFFNVDLALFKTQMAAFAPVAPLAWSEALDKAATAHSNLMIQTDTQSHNLPGEAGLLERIQAAGYTQLSSVGENIYAYSKSVEHGHAGFIIDWGSGPGGMQDPAGHRISILSDRYSEIGIGAIAEDNSATKVGPNVVTQNFGNRFDYQAQLLGVTFRDKDADTFYDAGEGLGGVTVTATGAGGTFTTMSWDSGGYQMVVPAGSYSVTFSGGGLAAPITKTAIVAQSNVKVDAMDGTGGTGGAKVGTTGSDLFVSQAANESFSGLEGIDTLKIGTNRADATLQGSDESGMVTTAVGGIDSLTSIERIAFDDGTLALDVGKDENAGTAFRIYQAAFGRTPDNAGLKFWINSVDNGLSFKGMAGSFNDASEFIALYGNTSNSAYAAALYKNVLGRDGDAAGSAFWANALDSGQADRADVLLGFTRSDENLTLTAAATQDGIFIV
ncbi:protein of unknown function [Fulvimarina manganoxydans]|uniref:Cysteine-rich secretory protein family protein n=1 Tax=Fulvimarina manganoxydans TaxID=937218 RepID=A0A1W2EEJ0_9HYPH|nr:DUF4214 domain-containing protein [Fulvimarina manganoxydans]SMD07726.1 protein of unknown function [Fulvimarina manganoxydans]